MEETPSQLAKWIEKRYFTLQEKFKKNTFTFADASKALFDSYNDSKKQVKVILSELKRAGYLKVSKNPKDEREKIYQLIDIFQPSGNLNRDELTNILKAAADIIRTRVDYTFILLLLFYKAVSDKWEIQFQERYNNAIKEDGLTKEEAIKEASQPYYHSFYLTQDLLWSNLRKDPLKLPENLSKNLKKIAELNPEYKDVFLQFDFHTFTSNQENSAILNNLFELFSKYSFESTSNDILGDAYEWILKYFAPQKAKEGEIFTPREVIRLMVEILSPEPQKYVYDPAVGSAGMLIVAYQYIKENYSKEKADTLFLRGQEQNGKTLALAKMNAILHDIRNIELLQGDTLLYPKFKSADGIKKFNYTIANPPWNQKGYNEDTLKKGEYWRERFPFGFPTKQSADWAWIQHMLASTENNGKTVVVLDTGAVSRGGREKNIRQKVLENDLFEAVILLPEKLFYNTGAPGLIIVFNKNKPKERKNKILLINATKEFLPGKPQNVLGKENIKKITDIYKNFKEVEKLSKIITLEEIIKNDYNLSPSRYISITEDEKYRPIEEIVKELKKIENERQQVDKKINEILKKIKF